MGLCPEHIKGEDKGNATLLRVYIQFCLLGGKQGNNKSIPPHLISWSKECASSSHLALKRCFCCCHHVGLLCFLQLLWIQTSNGKLEHAIEYYTTRLWGKGAMRRKSQQHTIKFSNMSCKLGILVKISRKKKKYKRSCQGYSYM